MFASFGSEINGHHLYIFITGCWAFSLHSFDQCRFHIQNRKIYLYKPSKKYKSPFIYITKEKNNITIEKVLYLQIEYELNLPWLARMDHLEHIECIERGEASDMWTGKAWFR